MNDEVKEPLIADDPEGWRRVRRFSVLDPSGEPENRVFPTVYVTDELLFDPFAAGPEAYENLRALAERAGWRLQPDEEIGGAPPDDQGEPRPDDKGDRPERPDDQGERPDGRPDEPDRPDDQPDAPRTGGTVRVRLRLDDARGRVVANPDAWALVRAARGTDWGRRGIGLHHVLSTDGLDVNPFKANPFKANPFKANPFKANPFKANALSVGIDSYAQPGFGGLQPVTVLGQWPSPFDDPAPDAPIVAIFDTGCGTHPWLDGAVVHPGVKMGIAPPPDESETKPSLAEPLDGIFDDAAGHGTFIAGIVRQECPAARILPVRIADGEGVILEIDLIHALRDLVTFMTDREPSRVIALNLSFSYYHETPQDPDTIPEMRALLDDIRALGCVVVCSAGNDATTRKALPAAIHAADPDRHVSVGALNPSNRSVALFSNIGKWVEVYAPGVSVVSTLPTGFEGGLQSGTRNDRIGRRRETLDADDFGGGFGVWSGTSFAAPVVAGRIAARIIDGDAPEAAKAAVVKELTSRDHSRTG